MRILFIIIVVGAIGYLGWVFRDELAGKIQTVTTETAPTTPASAAAATPESPALPSATPAPKQFAPPGSYYVTKRVSVEIPNGVKALNAGEMVKLLYRNRDGTARVTTGKDEITVKESLLTSDPDLVGK